MQNLARDGRPAERQATRHELSVPLLYQLGSRAGQTDHPLVVGLALGELLTVRTVQECQDVCDAHPLEVEHLALFERHRRRVEVGQHEQEVVRERAVLPPVFGGEVAARDADVPAERRVDDVTGQTSDATLFVPLPDARVEGVQDDVQRRLVAKRSRHSCRHVPGPADRVTRIPHVTALRTPELREQVAPPIGHEEVHTGVVVAVGVDLLLALDLAGGFTSGSQDLDQFVCHHRSFLGVWRV